MQIMLWEQKDYNSSFVREVNLKYSTSTHLQNIIKSFPYIKISPVNFPINSISLIHLLVSVFISETGRVLTTMKAGDFFGEIGILNLDGLNK
jgi:hypothetical protein